MSKNLSVKDELLAMSSFFEHVSADKFTISKSDFYEYEKGKYRYSIVTPSRRMASSLSTDRELLVLFINFETLQARTIATAIEIITTYEGRLDKQTVIICHKSEAGNNSLKAWGRELGLRILPLYLQSNGLKQEFNIEQALRRELFSQDPFDITGPVSDDEHFFGRRTEAIELARKLQTGCIRSLMGIRKIGKTSILNRIINECRRSHACICIMIDCSRDSIWQLNASGLMNSIFKSIKRSIDNGTNYELVIGESSSNNISVESNFLEKTVQQCDKPVIIFFDEFDYITPSSPTTSIWEREFNIFWRNFRAVYQEATRSDAKLSLLICGVTSKWFYQESIDGMENAALNLIPEEYLSPLPVGASIAMVKKLFKLVGISVDEDVLTIISTATACMPYWTRKLCSYINSSIDVSLRPCFLKQEDTERLIKEFSDSDGSAIVRLALQHLFKVYPEIREPFEACHQRDISSISITNIRILNSYGLIAGRSNLLNGIFIEQGYNCLTCDPSTPEQGLTSKEETSNINFNEWADELAAINKRRNVLEKKLRNICLNFIRYDALGKKDVSTKTRVLSVIPTQDRPRFDSLASEDIIGKYNWTQLVSLFLKEWPLFEKIFGSKKDFERNAEIINDRYDAHAKDADQADFALYRRAIKQIEERLITVE